MRAFVMSTFALAAAVALVPSVAYAQSQQQPQQQQQQAPAAAAQPTAPKLTFTTPAGILLVQVKSGNSTCPEAGAAQPAPATPPAGGQPPAGQAAAPPCTPQPYTQIFEEMIGKLKAAFASSSAPDDVKAQANSWKFYKSSDPGPGGTIMYVMVIDPAVPNTEEYQFFEVIQKSLTPDQQRDPATAQMYSRFNSAIAGMSKLDVTPVSGGQ